MDSPTVKATRKVHRGILHRIGESLGKFEQNLGLSSPGQSNNFRSSFHGSTTSDQHRQPSDHQKQDDNMSLQHYPNSSSDSLTAVLRKKKSHRSHQHTIPVPPNDSQEFNEPKARDSSLLYDREMQIVCQDLIANHADKLQTCREYDKKVSLLRIAVSFNTPKVTVPVMLFLENTLSRSLFYDLLKQHPSAVKNYMNLAKVRLDDEHYIAMLKRFGRNKNVAMIRIRQSSETDNMNSKIALIDQAALELQSHSWWYSQVLEYQHLLRKQQELQRSLSSIQPNIRLENQTLLRTYKIVFDVDFRQQKYKGNTDRTIAARVKEIENDFRMSAEMIICGQLAVIMKCGFRMHYDDFVQHAIHQGVFGKKYIIAPETLSEMVYNWIVLSGEGQAKASEKAGEFLHLVANPERKIYYAEKFQNYDIAMDTIVHTLRDRVQLENLRRHIPQDHPSFLRATALLENTKWRT